jgi:acyl carrier protein
MNQGGLVKGQVQAEILEIILTALKGVRDGEGKGLEIEVSPATTLYGQGSDLDSLALIQLLIDVEKRVGERFGPVAILTDEKAMSQEDSPLRTVNSMAEHLATWITKPRA